MVLDERRFPRSSRDEIADALASLPRLERLETKSDGCGGLCKALFCLGDGLSRLTALTELDLRCGGAESSVLPARTMPALRRLIIGDYGILEHPAADALADVLAKLPLLLSLELQGVSLGRRAVRVVEACSSTLTELDLSHTNLGGQSDDEEEPGGGQGGGGGGRAAAAGQAGTELGRALAQLVQLQQLGLSDNSLSDAFVEALALQLVPLQTLRVLCFSQNATSAATATAVRALLPGVHVNDD